METIPGARVHGSLVRRLFFEGKALGTRLGYIMPGAHQIWYAPDHADWFVAVHLLIFHILMIPNKDAPGWFGTGQAVGWCTSQPRPQGVLIAVNGVVPSK